MAKSVSLSGLMKDSKDPDKEAAQYLVQLSGEENNKENNSSNSNNYGHSKNNMEEEKDNNNDEFSSSSNKEEMIGRETAIFQQKKRRYRSIVSIYRKTKPLEITQPKKTRLRC